MRLFSFFILFIISFVFSTCNNLEDAPMSSRNSFIKIYEGPYSITAVDLIIIPEGYAVLGTVRLPNESVATVAFKTDKKGNRITDFVPILGNSAGKSFTHFDGGYIIVGDSIQIDLSSPLVENIEIVTAQVLVVNEEFDIVQYRSFKDTAEHTEVNPYYNDYFGESVTITSTGQVVVLGSYRNGEEGQLQKPMKSFIHALTPNFEHDWSQTFDLITSNTKNARSIHSFNDKLYWASSTQRTQGDLTFSYLSLPVVKNESVFINNDVLGELSNQIYQPNDIQPAYYEGTGFGVIGTYSQSTDGSQANIFFLKTTAAGDIQESTIRYFDAIGSASGVAVDPGTSQIIDSGEALAHTSDQGFILAGTYVSNPQLGKGAKDIFLIKLDKDANTQWVKTFGGSGNEDVVSVIQTADKGFIICGTSTIGTYSTPILIKTDQFGDLTN